MKRKISVTVGSGPSQVPENINQLAALSQSRLNQAIPGTSFPQEKVYSPPVFNPNNPVPVFSPETKIDQQLGDENNKLNNQPTALKAEYDFPLIPPQRVEPEKPKQYEHLVTTEPELLGDFSERIILPSLCVFYDFKDIMIRPFDVPRLAKLYRAIKARDFILFNDVLDWSINVDIRNMWTVDVKYIMHWHKINSFIQMPHITKWTSIYGNKNDTTIEMTDLVVDPLKMTEERVAYWQSKGITYPCLRDQEHYESFNDNLQDDDRYLYERAFYLLDGTLHDRKARLEHEKSLDILYQIKEFRKELNEIELELKARVRDKHFQKGDAIEKLSKELEGIDQILAEETNIPPNLEAFLQDRKEIVSTELNRLTSNTGEAEPLLETIVLDIQVFDFFPDL